MTKQCVIIGCGSHASSVISIVESSTDNYEIIGLVDTAEIFDPNEKKSGYNVLFNLTEMLDFSDRYMDLFCVIAIGDNNKRKLVFDLLMRNNFRVPTIISSNSFVDRTVDLGKGNIISHAVVINSNAKLGCNNLINTGVLIEHDCVVSNHTHIGPRAVLCGGVSISDSTFVGAGSVIVPNVFVAEDSTISAGAVLITDIRDKASTFIGVPAKAKRK